MARPREFDESQVIDAVMQQFWSHGYEATSVDDLCAVTGLNRSSLYGAFGSKRQLLDTALTAYEKLAAARTASLLRQYRPIREGLRRFLLGLFEDSVQDRGQWGCLIGNSAGELAMRDDAAQKRLRSSLQRIESVLHEALTEAQQNGEIAANTNITALSRFLMAQAQGLRLVNKTRPDRALLDDIVSTALSVVH